MTMKTETELKRILLRAVTYAEAGKFEEAQRWGEVLLRKLELAAVFKAGSVSVKGALTLWAQPSRGPNAALVKGTNED